MFFTVQNLPHEVTLEALHGQQRGAILWILALERQVAVQNSNPEEREKKIRANEPLSRKG